MTEVSKIPKNKSSCEDLDNLSKQDLIERIRTLEAHNLQLKNLITKSVLRKENKNKKQKPFDFNSCTFRHVLLKFYYLGWDYQGYAVQEDTNNAIENYIFDALIKTCLIKDRNSSNYHRCGRTDKGVSSFNQAISIDLRSKLPKDQQHNLNEEIDYCKILNKVLPDDIQCIAWSPVDDNFSARFDCKSRTYKYFFAKGNLNIEAMNSAAKYFLGTHDFRNFCKMDVGNGVVKFIRNISSFEIVPFLTSKECDREKYQMYVAVIQGQAFLWHQIRCIMGVLLLIGEGKENQGVILELLDVEKNSRKPDYNMASEIPLNLYSCQYENIIWQYNTSSLTSVLQKLQQIWVFNSVKTTMIRSMLNDIEDSVMSNGDTTIQSEISMIDCLLKGVKAKKYTPLLQRPKCESLEDRIKHYVKRRRIEVTHTENEIEVIKKTNEHK